MSVRRRNKSDLRLREQLPELADAIEIHHASLDRSVRLEVEDRLKNGELRAVVCSTSLELGIDIGAVDLVVMVATPKGVSRAIQRIGRSGHSLNKNSHGILVATNVNDLVEATVTAKLVRERALDPIKILDKPFDVVAQHIVGIVALAPASADSIYQLITRARPFHDLTREEFDRVLNYLEGGGEALAQQYRGVFGKISVSDDGMVCAGDIRGGARISGQYRNDRFGRVRRRHVEAAPARFGRRRISSRDCKLAICSCSAGRVVRLIDTGVQEAFRRAGRWPTADHSALERGQNAAHLRSGPGRAATARRFGCNSLRQRNKRRS